MKKKALAKINQILTGWPKDFLSLPLGVSNGEDIVNIVQACGSI